jgi:TrmH family RNA methyltransferase
VPFVRLAQTDEVTAFIAQMRQRHPRFTTFGTTAHAARCISDADLTVPLLFFIGNETEGLCQAYKELVDDMLTVPLAGDSFASSLNVGCAATVMLYEATRQRAACHSDAI